MPYIKSTKIVPFPLQVIYKAFADVETYPDILSYIQSVTILDRQADDMRVEVKLGTKYFSISYECIVHFDWDQMITVEAVSGPFQYLKSQLKFMALDHNRTKIDYHFNSRFKSVAMERLANLLFVQQFQSSLAAFERFLRRKS